MQVLSPVGTFPLKVTGVRVAGGAPRVQTAMGAWHSEVTVEPRDLPLLAAAAGVLALTFALGRLSATHR